MNKKIVISSTLALFVGIAGGALSMYGFKPWQAEEPSKEALSQILADGALKTERGVMSSGPACIDLPVQPAPDARSETKKALAWHMDFVQDPPATIDHSRREKQLQQLDALTAAGLLQKTAIHVTQNGETKAATRYQPTEQAWLASGYQRQDCFIFGKTQFLEIKRIEKSVVNKEAGLQTLLVNTRVGIASENDLLPWAKDPALRAVFPEIEKQLEGQMSSVQLVRGAGKWMELSKALRQGYVPPKTIEPTGKPEDAEKQRKIDEMHQQNAAYNALPRPTLDEVKKLITESYTQKKIDATPQCLLLPYGAQFPIDKDLGRGEVDSASQLLIRRYAVAIFTDKMRDAKDPVVTKSLPYLETLVQLGVLTKRTQSRIEGTRSDSEKFFTADIYEAAPAYQSRSVKDKAHCFSFGEPSVTILDAEINETDFMQMGWKTQSSYRYKVLLKYDNAPEWMKDPVLLEKWPGLRERLEKGRACQGEYQFDRQKRSQSSGFASCWWRFDSVGD